MAEPEDRERLSVRFVDAHCDTIGKIWENKADFTGQDEASGLHVTLPGLHEAGVCAQVFASWVWREKYKGREVETALAKVEAVRRLCADLPADLVLVTDSAGLEETCGLSRPGGPIRSHDPGHPDDSARTGVPRASRQPGPRTAVIASLEGADPLDGRVDNLDLFYDLGIRLITLAWGDNPFCGSVFGSGSGLTNVGAELVAACEERGVLVDVSHASDEAFKDICRVATKPFIASHSNCRALCPNPRNLTDDMIRAVADREGVVGIGLAPGFLSPEFFAHEKAVSTEFFRSVAAGTASVEQAGRRSSAAVARIPRPPLESIVDHISWAINVGGEDAVGLGGDLDGIDALPLGLEGVGDYPLIARLLSEVGLTEVQVDKVCYRNFARVFAESLG